MGHSDRWPEGAGTDLTRSLYAWWCFACEEKSITRANDRYAIVTTRGWGEYEQGVRELLKRSVGGDFLLPIGSIRATLANFPCEVIYKGTPRAAAHIKLRERQVFIDQSAVITLPAIAP